MTKTSRFFALCLAAGALGAGYLTLTTVPAAAPPASPWIRGEAPGGAIRAVALDPRDDGTVYFATAEGVLKSLDGGAHWTPCNQGLPTTDVRAIAMDPPLSQHPLRGHRRRPTARERGRG